jgi:TorA maturation chaperone TorD
MFAEATSGFSVDGSDLAAGVAALNAFVAANEDSDRETLLETLKVAYSRLFIGYGLPFVIPYESAYLDTDGQSSAEPVMGPSSVAVRRAYRIHGLGASADNAELPDHIAMELEFLYFLTDCERKAWASGDALAARELQREQWAFLTGHLGRWVADFTRRVREYEDSDCALYLAMSDILRAYVAMDTALLATFTE